MEIDLLARAVLKADQEGGHECCDLASEPQCRESVLLWHERLVQKLANHPKGFSDGAELIAGK